MDFDGIELRELERISEPHIPACIQILIIDKGIGKKIEAKTTDFNSKGVRLLIPSKDNDFERNESIIITPQDDSYRLVGEIRHIVHIHDNTTYLGIRFHNIKSLHRYIDLIEDGELK